MKNRMIFFGSFLLWLLALPVVKAQQQVCYSDLRARGIFRLQVSDYRQAIDQFIAARFCMDKPEGDDLDSLIRAAQDAWVVALEQEKRKAEQAAHEALLAKEVAEKARAEADSLRKIAEAYAKEAEKEARSAQANRLALLSENLSKTADYEEALYLAFVSLRAMDTQASDQIRQAFSRAMYNARKEEIRFPALVTGYQWVPDGSGLLVILEDQTVQLVGVVPPSAFELAKYKGPVLATAATRKGSVFLACSADGTAELLDKTGKQIALLKGHEAEVVGGLFDPEEEWVLTCSRDHTARLWTAEDGRLVATLSGHEGHVYQGRFSPDRKKLLTRSSDGTVRIWDLPSGAPAGQLSGQAPYIYTAEFAPDGNTILTASADGTARLWNLQGQLLANMDAHHSPVKEAHFSPAGDRILTRALDPVVYLWKSDGMLQTALKGHTAPVSSAVFNAAGNRILTASLDATVRLWDIEGRLLQTWPSSKALLSAVFSPYENFIATTGQDGAVRLWEMAGTPLFDINIRTPYPFPATFSSDGKWIAAVSGSTLIVSPMPQIVYFGFTQRKILAEDRYDEWNKKHHIPPSMLNGYKP